MFDYKLYEKMKKSSQFKNVVRDGNSTINFVYKRQYYNIYFDSNPTSQTARKFPVYIHKMGEKHFNWIYILNFPRNYLNIQKIVKAIDRYEKNSHLSTLQYTELINQQKI